MKPILILITVFLSINITAQIPNPSFEDSSFAKYPSGVVGWSTPNLFYVDKSASETVLELYNNDDGTNPVNLISDINTLDFDAAKGFPINGRPDSLIVWMKYYISSGDTLIIRTKNRETGNAFGYGEKVITVSSNNEIERIATKINYTSPGFADSGVIQVFVKPNGMSNWHGVDIQKMRFVNFGGSVLDVIPNDEFDNFEEDSIVTPKGWLTISYASKLEGFEFPDGVEQFTTDASNGSRAMLLENKEQDGEVAFGLLAAISFEQFADYNGDIDDPEPMFPVDKKYASLTGDYKLINTLPDTGLIAVAMFANGVLVGEKLLDLPKTEGTGYVSFEAHIDYDGFNGTPDSASIFIFSAKDEGVIGTKLYIDNLAWLETTDISKVLPKGISCYPNPASGKIYIKSETEKITNVSVLDLAGKTLIPYQIDGLDSIDVSKIAAGNYLLSIQTAENIYYQKITIK